MLRQFQYKNRLCITSIALVFISFYSSLISAQAVQPNLQGRSEVDVVLPDFMPEIQQPGTILPPVPALVDKPSSSLYTDEAFVLKTVRITGNSVIDKEELQVIFSPYIDTTIRLSDLQKLRDRVTQAYVSKGYINSGAILPDQIIQQGIVHMQIVEGSLSEINVQTSHLYKPDYFANRLEAITQPAVNIPLLQEALYLWQQDIRIKKIEAELKPGEVAGQSLLDVVVTENPASTMQLLLNNHQAPAIGAEGIAIDWQHNNLWGHAESILLNAKKTEGLTTLNIDYAWPINLRDDEINLFLHASDSDVITGEFESLDIESRSQTIGMRYQRPLLRKRHQTINWFLSAELRKSKSLLLGEGFSFSAGPEDGVSKLTVVRSGIDWQTRQPGRVLAARANISLGLDALDATTHDNQQPDGEFVSLLIQSQWAERLPWKQSVLIAKADLQWSDESLLGLEQFVVGGQASVRGYRENSLVRDQGAVASIEWQIPYYSNQAGANHQLALFYDAGFTENIDRITTGVKSISSVGMGLLGQFNTALHYQLYIADGLKNIVPLNDKDLQDDGVHFQIGYVF